MYHLLIVYKQYNAMMFINLFCSTIFKFIATSKKVVSVWVHPVYVSGFVFMSTESCNDKDAVQDILILLSERNDRYTAHITC